MQSPSANAAQAALRARKTDKSVVDALLQRLSIRRTGLTYVIGIHFESTDPAKAAVIANAFADDYLLEQLEAKFDATKQASAWLEDRLGQLRGQVEQANPRLPSIAPPTAS